MEQRGDEVRVTTTEASGGRKLGVMRWVLGISLVLAAIAKFQIFAGGTQSVG